VCKQHSKVTQQIKKKWKIKYKINFTWQRITKKIHNIKGKYCSDNTKTKNKTWHEKILFLFQQQRCWQLTNICHGEKKNKMMDQLTQKWEIYCEKKIEEEEKERVLAIGTSGRDTQGMAWCAPTHEKRKAVYLTVSRHVDAGPEEQLLFFCRNFMDQNQWFRDFLPKF